MKACEHGFRVAFATAQEWVSRLEAAQDRNQLEGELRRLERYQLLVVDEVGYLPLERQAANLLFALVSRRYERGSIIVTSNRSFEQWGEILGDAMVAAALIDRLVHHATMVTLKARATACANVAPASRPPPRLRRYAAPPERQTGQICPTETMRRLPASRSKGSQTPDLRAGPPSRQSGTAVHFSAPDIGALFGAP
jgi:hypothetical protein